MMHFLATEYRADGEYGVSFEAPTQGDAARICNERGWALSGQVAAVIPASPAFGHAEADSLVADLNEAERATKQ